MAEKIRLDVYLVQHKFAETRNRAQQLVRGGYVTVDGHTILKTGELVERKSKIVVNNILKYVSRGGNKLEYALDSFQIDVKDKRTADVGASTGGFTDCLLQKGAKRVFAIDIGKGQLHQKLRKNPRVIYIDGTDIRYLSKLPNNTKLDFIAIDISKHSLESIIFAVKNLLNENGDMVALIKPQFELQRHIVSDKDSRKRALYKVAECIKKYDMYVVGLVHSPLKGGLKNQGNIEYLMHIAQRPKNFDVYRTIERLIAKEQNL